MKLKYKLLLLYAGAALFIMLVIGSFLATALKEVTIERIARNYQQQLKHIDFGLTRLIKGMEYSLKTIAQNELVRSREDENFTSFLDDDELKDAAVPAVFDLAKGLSQSHPDQAF